MILISDTWGARHQGDSPETALWTINEGYTFGLTLDGLQVQNNKIRVIGKLRVEGRELTMLRQVCMIYLTDNTPVTYTITYFVDEAGTAPGGPQRGYFALRIEVRSTNSAYLQRKYQLLIDEINREFTTPISPVPGRNGIYYQWGSVPTVWRQWPMELYYQESQNGQITYYHFSQLGQNQGEKNQRYSVQTLYNWVIGSR
jgi:hypothetical protein